MPSNELHDLRDVFLYTMIDDYLLSCNHAPSTGCSASGKPAKLSDSEVLYLFLLACLSYGGNCQEALRSAKRCGDIKVKLSRSQFNRRIHRLQDRLLEIFALLALLVKEVNQSYALDSFPLPVCKNIRIRRNKLLADEQFRGYNASKREYFYGLKVHLITAADGRVVEFDFTPGSVSDLVAFELLNFDLPAGSEVFADKIYNAYQQEEQLQQQAQIYFQPIRKSNSQKADNTYVHNWLRKQQRRHIETDISQLTARMPKRIQAVTQKGFMLKIVGFILAYNLLFYF
jgi:hypothetical protein